MLGAARGYLIEIHDKHPEIFETTEVMTHSMMMLLLLLLLLLSMLLLSMLLSVLPTPSPIFLN